MNVKLLIDWSTSRIQNKWLFFLSDLTKYSNLGAKILPLSTNPVEKADLSTQKNLSELVDSIPDLP